MTHQHIMLSAWPQRCPTRKCEYFWASYARSSTENKNAITLADVNSEMKHQPRRDIHAIAFTPSAQMQTRAPCMDCVLLETCEYKGRFERSNDIMKKAWTTVDVTSATGQRCLTRYTPHSSVIIATKIIDHTCLFHPSTFVCLSGT